jgi:hypothetical protein
LLADLTRPEGNHRAANQPMGSIDDAHDAKRGRLRPYPFRHAETVEEADCRHHQGSCSLIVLSNVRADQRDWKACLCKTQCGYQPSRAGAGDQDVR